MHEPIAARAPRRHDARSRTSRAFTLIELLVVITVLGILVAILLPAMNLVRDAARGAQCGSHLRQMAIANYGYANDWDGALVPVVNKVGGNWDWNSIWIQNDDFLDRFTEGRSHVTQCLPASLVCPTSLPRNPLLLIRLSYGFNHVVMPPTEPVDGPFCVYQGQVAPQRLMFADALDWLIGWWGAGS